MKAMLIFLSLFAVAFAGCVGDDPAPVEKEPEREPTVTAPAEPARGYIVDPNTANQSVLDGAHDHDAWGSAMELILLDTTVNTDDCATATQNGILLSRSLQDEQSAHLGCAWFRLAEGTIVPEGTESLSIAMDATQLDASKQGGIALYYRNSQTGGMIFAEATDDLEYTFTIPVAPEEWDIPHAEETTWGFQLRPHGQVATMQGDIGLFVAAHRMANWIPILGSRHIDHWAPDAPHTFISPDIIYVMDQEVHMESPSYVAGLTSDNEGIQVFAMEDIIPPGTSIVSVVVQYSQINGCRNDGDVIGCWIEPRFNPAQSTATYGGIEVERTATYGIYTFAVPEPIVPDSTYAKESTYAVWLNVFGCPGGNQDTVQGRFDECHGNTVDDLSADVRIEVEAWRTGFNANQLKARLGL